MAHPQDLQKALEQLVTGAFQASAPGAACLLIQKGQVIYRDGIGLANLEHEIPLTPEMPFRLASLTKPITATAILKLAEAGQLALTDPLTRFLPDYPMGETPITLEHLLTHTSGLRNYTELPEWWAVHRQDLGVDQLLDLFKAQPVAFAPGTSWAYCNSGYALLGAILEKISGKPYGECLNELIFAPLEMQKTSYEASPARVIPQLVSGYTKIPGAYLHPEYLSNTQVYAAGGLVSTLDDLARWFAALRNGQLLSPKMLQPMWTPYLLADGTSTHYGYGWMLSQLEDRRVVEHYGLLPGFANYLLALPDEDLLVVILSNDDGNVNETERLAFHMATLALDRPYRPPASLPLAVAELARFAGSYQAENGSPVLIEEEAGSLVLQLAAGQRLALQPVSELEFFCPQNPVSRLVFSSNTRQQITALKWLPRRGRPLRAQKSH
jgi:CubicO group peptidase (beta-lactamase class C family)